MDKCPDERPEASSGKQKAQLESISNCARSTLYPPPSTLDPISRRFSALARWHRSPLRRAGWTAGRTLCRCLLSVRFHHVPMSAAGRCSLPAFSDSSPPMRPASPTASDCMNRFPLHPYGRQSGGRYSDTSRGSLQGDGTVAFVRGQDYHVDWIYPGGNAVSTAKLPFDWKRVGDEGKQALIDAARTARERQIATARATGADVWTAIRTDQVVGVGGDSRGHAESGRGRVTAGVSTHASPDESARAHSAAQTKIEFVPLSEIADYYPAIRAGAATPDLDGRLWILPSTSAQSKAGELVYDVVKPNGQLSHRVRLPAGRSIAGFGRDGVAYLMNKTDTGWKVDRTRDV